MHGCVIGVNNLNVIPKDISFKCCKKQTKTVSKNWTTVIPLSTSIRNTHSSRRIVKIGFSNLIAAERYSPDVLELECSNRVSIETVNPSKTTEDRLIMGLSLESSGIWKIEKGDGFSSFYFQYFMDLWTHRGISLAEVSDEQVFSIRPGCHIQCFTQCRMTFAYSFALAVILECTCMTTFSNRTWNVTNTTWLRLLWDNEKANLHEWVHRKIWPILQDSHTVVYHQNRQHSNDSLDLHWPLFYFELRPPIHHPDLLHLVFCFWECPHAHQNTRPAFPLSHWMRGYD